jgi:DMSO reductase anchor subunit
MAAQVFLMIFAIATGACVGALLLLFLAMGRDDRRQKWGLRSDAVTSSEKAARTLVGISRPRWDD